jgi:hypothetical protein
MGKKSMKATSKKKRISKHILKSKEVTTPATAVDGENEHSITPLEKGINDTSSELVTPNSINNNTETVSTLRQTKKDGHLKDPEEATTYLTTWKTFQQNTEKSSSASSLVWKFNKNTQSWLIRHMYEADKVPKRTFVLLLEYLQGLQGDKTQLRIVSEAARRARRYKDHFQSQQESTASEPNDKNGDKDDHITSTDRQTNTFTCKSTATSKEDWEQKQENIHWRQLSDHDKRREYKRARKVLEVVKIGRRE